MKMKRLFYLIFPLVACFTCCNPIAEEKNNQEDSGVRLELVESATNPTTFNLISSNQELLEGKPLRFELGDPSFFEGPTGGKLYCSFNNTLALHSTSPIVPLNTPLNAGSLCLFSCLKDANGFSIKTSQSLVKEVKRDTSETSQYNISAPHAFLLSPEKGHSYPVDKVSIDIFPVNTSLSTGGNRVELILNNTDTLFIEKMTNFYLKGLPPGAHQLQMTLIDKNNKMIPGPFNRTQRPFNIQPKQP